MLKLVEIGWVVNGVSETGMVARWCNTVLTLSVAMGASLQALCLTALCTLHARQLLQLEHGVILVWDTVREVGHVRSLGWCTEIG